MSDRQQNANALRVLAMDAVQKANSGHPGMPMGMADIAEVLWRDYIKCNPKHPSWFDRDRFVLSNGHGSMLLYAALHLSGYDISIEDLKKFRQLHSKTPGHPEVAEAPGVETTTGPLGQGVANAVGMALAEQNLAKHFNRPGFNIVDHYTYAFVGDGCLMEGISHEVCSLAGTWKLGKLIVFWDDNGISIDGDVSGWFTDNTPQRFEAYQWQVIKDIDGHDANAIKKAIDVARENQDQPTLICCKTTIGFGSPNLAGTAKTHGSPLGDKEIAAVREQLHWPHPPFEIPDTIKKAWDLTQKGNDTELLWNHMFSKYETDYPDLSSEFLRRLQGFLPESWHAQSNAYIGASVVQAKPAATRKLSQQCLNAYGPLLPELLGGSADLTGSNCTAWSGDNDYIEYGVREFGMSAIMNGLALHGGFIPYGGTFLTFSDYARNAVRMSALMKQRVIYVYTHDSIGLGEDGPTHQAVEHAAALRLIPHLNVWRPCDLTETAVAWQHSIENEGPSCLLLSRQDVAVQTHTDKTIANIRRGAYVLYEPAGELNGIFIATGSEVMLAVEAAKQLAQEGLKVRVVSMPCCEVFLQQESDYRDSVLPESVQTRVAIEAGVTATWYQFVGCKGRVLGIDQFGLSAPADQVYAELGLTVEDLKQEFLDLLLLI